MLSDFWARVHLVLDEARASAEEIAQDLPEITADHAFHVWQRKLEQRLANRRSGVPRVPLVWGVVQPVRTEQRERAEPNVGIVTNERAAGSEGIVSSERRVRPLVVKP